MSKRTCAGFMLLEAILTVVIVSISLTFIMQSLLTNFRTGLRFQEAVRSLMVMENRLGMLYATNASRDFLTPAALEKPYEQFTGSARRQVINPVLARVDLTLEWPSGKRRGSLTTSTVIYDADEIKINT